MSPHELCQPARAYAPACEHRKDQLTVPASAHPGARWRYRCGQTISWPSVLL